MKHCRKWVKIVILRNRNPLERLVKRSTTVPIELENGGL